jgi:hypothetical protein
MKHAKVTVVAVVVCCGLVAAPSSFARLAPTHEIRLPVPSTAPMGEGCDRAAMQCDPGIPSDVIHEPCVVDPFLGSPRCRV